MPDPDDQLRALDFLELADAFYQAFIDLPVRELSWSSWWPRYFMLCHAIELALKAYLAQHGFTDWGHDLTNLLTKAINKGLPLESANRAEIQCLHEAHKKYWHRYPREHNDAGKPVFIIEEFEPSARELLRAVATCVRGPNYKSYVNY